MAKLCGLHRFSSLSLAHQFIAITAIVVLPGVGFLVHWTASRIEAAVHEEVGLRAGLYLEALLAPYILELSSRRTPPEDGIAFIGQAPATAPARPDLATARLWSVEGRILLSTQPGGQALRPPVEGGLAKALAGDVAVEFERSPGSQSGIPAEKPLQVYVPIRQAPDEPVLAVAEFSHHMPSLLVIPYWTRVQTWLVIGAVLAASLSALYAVAARGDARIVRQRIELSERASELKRLQDRNETLHIGIQELSRINGEQAELTLRRIGADIHDGIGQLLTVSLLKLDQLFSEEQRGRDYWTLRDSLGEALSEVRAMISGLLLPHVLEKNLAEAVTTIISKHEHRFSTKVDFSISNDVGEVDDWVKVAICRMVQEGLNNAFRHAAGAHQAVVLRSHGQFVAVEVRDDGPGLVFAGAGRKREPFGLIGLRDRILNLGGEFTISSTPGEGTTLSACFPRTIRGS